jgi:hypothetical protein
VLIGFVWEWLREMKHRTTASQKTREVSRLERELAVLKDSTVRAEGRGSGPAGQAGLMQGCPGQDLRAADAGRCGRGGDGGGRLCRVQCSSRKARASVTLDRGARWLWPRPVGLCKVALTVDADDATLDAIVEGGALGHAAASRP